MIRSNSSAPNTSCNRSALVMLTNCIFVASLITGSCALQWCWNFITSSSASSMVQTTLSFPLNISNTSSARKQEEAHAPCPSGSRSAINCVKSAHDEFRIPFRKPLAPKCGAFSDLVLGSAICASRSVNAGATTKSLHSEMSRMGSFFCAEALKLSSSSRNALFSDARVLKAVARVASDDRKSSCIASLSTSVPAPGPPPGGRGMAAR
mmetsp:Transcript_34725/g.100092  ORF Transcript_34725/g.100092 Transcript_34725/m.100092 type:complete len:208 (-) Transcript_34725:55-678(-)